MKKICIFCFVFVDANVVMSATERKQKRQTSILNVVLSNKRMGVAARTRSHQRKKVEEKNCSIVMLTDALTQHVFTFLTIHEHVQLACTHSHLRLLAQTIDSWCNTMTLDWANMSQTKTTGRSFQTRTKRITEINVYPNQVPMFRNTDVVISKLTQSLYAARHKHLQIQCWMSTLPVILRSLNLTHLVSLTIWIPGHNIDLDFMAKQDTNINCSIGQACPQLKYLCIEGGCMLKKSSQTAPVDLPFRLQRLTLAFEMVQLLKMGDPSFTVPELEFHQANYVVAPLHRLIPKACSLKLEKLTFINGAPNCSDPDPEAHPMPELRSLVFRNHYLHHWQLVAEMLQHSHNVEELVLDYPMMLLDWDVGLTEQFTAYFKLIIRQHKLKHLDFGPDLVWIGEISIHPEAVNGCWPELDTLKVFTATVDNSELPANCFPKLRVLHVLFSQAVFNHEEAIRTLLRPTLLHLYVAPLVDYGYDTEAEAIDDNFPGLRESVMRVAPQCQIHIDLDKQYLDRSWTNV